MQPPLLPIRRGIRKLIFLPIWGGLCFKKKREVQKIMFFFHDPLKTPPPPKAYKEGVICISYSPSPQKMLPWECRNLMHALHGRWDTKENMGKETVVHLFLETGDIKKKSRQDFPAPPRKIGCRRPVANANQSEKIGHFWHLAVKTDDIKLSSSQNQLSHTLARGGSNPLAHFQRPPILRLCTQKLCIPTAQK